MDFPFYVVDLRAEFGARVIDNFVSEYLSGRTPNPCVMCNREIKFDRLRERAAALGADYVATGHYARIERDPRGRFHLLRAADATKDQSYFLFTLGQLELSRTLFPLGAMTKAEVRARARAAWSRQRRQAREPGDLLRARRRLRPLRRASGRPRASSSRHVSSISRGGRWQPTTECIVSPSDSAADSA